MWFRNLIVYRIPEGWNATPEALGDQLAHLAFAPAASIEAASVGWAPPRPDDPALVHATHRQWLLCLRHEKKLLPARVVARFVRERVERIEAEEGFRPGRKRMKELKDAVRDELLPRAFSLTSDTRVWIDPTAGWLAIDAASQARADEAITLLIKAVDGLPVRKLAVTEPAAGAMTAWLVGNDAPGGFTIDQDAELRAREGKATVRYANQALEQDDITRHTRAGKQCTRLALTWADRVSFVLTEKLEVKRVRPLDVLKEPSDPSGVDEAERFASDFTLMTGELSKLLSDLVDALGGFAADIAPRTARPETAADAPPF